MTIDTRPDDVRQLQACIRDLTSLMALPALWQGQEPSQIVDTLLDALVGMLRLDVAGVRLHDAAGGALSEAVRLGQPDPPYAAEEIGPALDRWLASAASDAPLKLANSAGAGEILLTRVRLGLSSELGVVIAGSQRADFPTATETLLLQVAANQLAIALQGSQLLAEHQRAEVQLREHLDIVETVSRTGQVMAAALDMRDLLQIVTDAATELSGAQFGAFFYIVVDEQGESYTLYTLSGVSREAFEQFPLPRNTDVFGPTFHDEEIVRLADVTADPRYGSNNSYRGMPPGHLPVRSYLAVPVVSRMGTVLGGLVFGHSQTGIFTDRAEHIVAGLAAQAAIAMDNARLYEELQDQVETHVALNAALRETAATRDQALADAQAALRIRDAFLASISHDLRTPLGAIKGFTQLVLRQAGRTPTLESAQVTELLTNVDRSTKKMAAMIDELLDLTRLEAGHSLELNREPTDLVILAHGLADEHQRGTHTHRIQIEAAVPALVGTWDEARLERVVANLLSNAIKYSPDGGTIAVTLTREETATGASAVVTVRDQGVGIPAVDLPHIFERFRRGANVAGQTHGIGIGLAGSKQIVEQHGGTITVTSTEGAGTTVTVRLPVDPPHDPDQVTDS